MIGQFLTVINNPDGWAVAYVNGELIIKDRPDAMIEGLPLALFQGLLDNRQLTPADLEAVIADEERNWADLTSPSGTWYDDPACLCPVEDGEPCT